MPGSTGRSIFDQTGCFCLLADAGIVVGWLAASLFSQGWAFNFRRSFPTRVQIRGAGSDSHVVDSLGDTVDEAFGYDIDDGAIDSVASSTASFFGQLVGQLTLTGAAAVTGTRNSAANIKPVTDRFLGSLTEILDRSSMKDSQRSAASIAHRLMLVRTCPGRPEFGVAVRYKQEMQPYIFTALLFGLTAAFSRSIFTLTHTRYQLALFLAVAVFFEVFGRKPITGSRPRVIGLLLNAGAIVTFMIAVKLAIDGPFNRPAWVRHLAATTGLPL